MPFADFSPEYLITFFAVLVRYGVLFAILPFVGDKVVPAPVKVLLALATTFALFPGLVKDGTIVPTQALDWAATPGGIASTIGTEVMVALVLGFTAKLAFDVISFSGNLAGHFMGFASASMFDPHQEQQTLVIAEVQMAIAMLLFLAIDGHHLMLRAALDSFRVIGLGGHAGIGLNGALAGNGTGLHGGLVIKEAFARRLIEITGEVIKFGIQLSAPVAVSLFAVNIAFAVVAKTMPQLNVLVLSFAVTALVGLAVMYLSLPEFSGAMTNLYGRMEEWMLGMGASLTGR